MATILVVEDEATLSDIICEKLVEEGFTAEKALDGQEAVDYFQGGKTADLVLLDILLPKMDGFSVLKAINDMAAEKGFTVPPVVIFSNFLHDEEEQRARALGAREFLVKAAFSTAEVVTKIKEILNAAPAATPAQE